MNDEGPPPPAGVLNPVDIENRIRQLADAIARGVSICSDRYAAFLDADHAFDLAEARAYLNSSGTVDARKAQVTIAVEAERRERNRTDTLYRYADRNAKALESELRAYQSVGASVRAMYQVAGRGER